SDQFQFKLLAVFIEVVWSALEFPDPVLFISTDSVAAAVSTSFECDSNSLLSCPIGALSRCCIEFLFSLVPLKVLLASFTHSASSGKDLIWDWMPCVGDVERGCSAAEVSSECFSVDRVYD